MSSSSYRAVGIALALAGVVTFSFRPILIKLAYGYVTDPVTLIALRMVFSLPFFIAAALWLRRDTAAPPLTRRDFWAVIYLGFLGYYLACRTVGLDSRASLERACRAAALCVTRPGAMDSIQSSSSTEQCPPIV